MNIKFFLIVLFLISFAKGEELLDFSLEELMDITVTSVSKTEETAFRAASAIYVISQEDLKRSGVRNIVEALRLVPGLQVNQDYGSAWQVGARGSDGRYSSKLLVLIDGRTIYTPVFSGVYFH